MELIDLLPNGQSFRRVATLDIGRHDPVPHDFTGRVRHSADGVVVAVGWYQNGHLHNPGRLHPAYRQFRVGGQVKYDHFYRHGVLHDPNESTPAVRGYYANGTTHYEERYRNGVREDADDGSPAVSKWRRDGTLRHVLRYRAGRRLANAATDSQTGRVTGAAPSRVL